MNQHAIECQGVGKRFRIGQSRGFWGRREPFWALKDISFAVEPGKCLGIIGHNGAGKSTLLKVLSGIMRPERGAVRVAGRLGCLIEISAGFHYELTGRENIFLQGAILGMPRRRIKAKLDSIIAFSGIEKFMDTPVKRYSSGMLVRLGFSVAIHLEPDVFLVDEVLAVGDINFRQKCGTRIAEMRKAGVSIILVSHNMIQIMRNCDHVMVLHKGEVVRDGDPSDTIRYYEELLGPQKEEGGNREVEITSIRLLDEKGEPCSEVELGAPMILEVGYQSHVKDLSEASFRIGLYNSYGIRGVVFDSGYDHVRLPDSDRPGIMRLRIDRVNLVPGSYLFNVSIYNHRGDYPYHQIMRACGFKVFGDLPSDGMLVMPHQWDQECC